MSETSEARPKSVEESKRRTGMAGFFARLVREKPLGTVGLVVILVLLFCAVFADLAWVGLPDVGVVPYGLNERHVRDRLEGPSVNYWLGTDQMGRDLLTRVIYAARAALLVGLGVNAIALIISLIGGMLCGFLGGIFDLVFQRFVDAWMGFPPLIILIALSSLFGTGLWQVIFIIGLQYGITGTRAVRGLVIATREDEYVDAAEAIGCSTWRVITRHILPNILPGEIVLFTASVPTAILLEASLSFLGFGIPPPHPSFGSMLAYGADIWGWQNPWMIFWPGFFLAIVVYGVNMFGDAVRDLIDPRLRGGTGSYAGTKMKKKKDQGRKAE